VVNEIANIIFLNDAALTENVHKGFYYKYLFLFLHFFKLLFFFLI
jgi:hypothetical protein